jgi:hypothetical protein
MSCIIARCSFEADAAARLRLAEALAMDEHRASTTPASGRSLRPGDAEEDG